MERFYFDAPSISRKEYAIEYINEFYEYDSDINGSGGLHRYLDDYEGWLKKIDDDSKREVSEEHVPALSYFLVRESDKRIVGIGYNGFPRGCSDDVFPWNKGDSDELNNKYPYVVHAEANCILNSSSNLMGSTLYVTLFPCNECAKLIIQSGIKHLVYMEDKYRNEISNIASRRMLDAAGIDYRKMDSIEVLLNVK